MSSSPPSAPSAVANRRAPSRSHHHDSGSLIQFHRTMQYCDVKCMAVIMSPGVPNRVWACLKDGRIFLLDALSSRRLEHISHNPSDPLPWCIAAVGTNVWVGTAAGTIIVYDPSTSPPRAVATLERSHKGGVHAIASAATPEGTVAYSCGADGKIFVWTSSGKALQTLSCPGSGGHTDAIRTLEIAHGTSTLYSGGDDHTVRVWSLSGDSVVLAGHTSGVRSLCVVGNTLWSGAANGEIRTWNTSTLAPLQAIRHHRAAVTSLLDCGDNVLSTSADRTVCLWNSQTAGLMEAVDAHAGWVAGAVVVARSVTTTVWTAGADRTVRVWSHDVPVNSLSANCGSLSASPVTSAIDAQASHAAIAQRNAALATENSELREALGVAVATNARLEHRMAHLQNLFDARSADQDAEIHRLHARPPTIVAPPEPEPEAPCCGADEAAKSPARERGDDYLRLLRERDQLSMESQRLVMLLESSQGSARAIAAEMKTTLDVLRGVLSPAECDAIIGPHSHDLNSFDSDACAGEVDPERFAARRIPVAEFAARAVNKLKQANSTLLSLRAAREADARRYEDTARMLNDVEQRAASAVDAATSAKDVASQGFRNDLDLAQAQINSLRIQVEENAARAETLQNMRNQQDSLVQQLRAAAEEADREKRLCVQRVDEYNETILCLSSEISELRKKLAAKPRTASRTRVPRICDTARVSPKRKVNTRPTREAVPPLSRTQFAHLASQSYSASAKCDRMLYYFIFQLLRKRHVAKSDLEGGISDIRSRLQYAIECQRAIIASSFTPNEKQLYSLTAIGTPRDLHALYSGEGAAGLGKAASELLNEHDEMYELDNLGSPEDKMNSYIERAIPSGSRPESEIDFHHTNVVYDDDDGSSEEDVEGWSVNHPGDLPDLGGLASAAQ